MRRRDLLGGMAALGAASALGIPPREANADLPPETTRIRIGRGPSLCQAPQVLVDDLLAAEGFTVREYVERDVASTSTLVAAGKVDVDNHFAGPLVIELDAGQPIVLLAGIHVGCFELFGTDKVRAVRDLKGKTVAVTELGLSQHVFLASMVAHVGLDPKKDVNFVAYPAAQAKQLLAEGKVDAYLGFPPDPQELRQKKIGHVIVNSSVDRPWSQYFCCFTIANRQFLQKHPVAVKRAVRALLKATDFCAQDPVGAARGLVDKGFTKRYDYAVQALKAIPFNKWRVYNPEDTLRFYALRLHEAGMVKSTPQKILAAGTDWRILSQLKKEMKA